MSEADSTCTNIPEEMGDQRQLLGGFAALSDAVGSFLSNSVLQASMDPWGHLEWALSLPALERPLDTPAMIVEALMEAKS